MDLTKLCRFCSMESNELKSIFSENTDRNLLTIINEVLKFSVLENDGLPSNICEPCSNSLLALKETIHNFRENEKNLRRKFLGQSAEDLEEGDMGSLMELERIEVSADLMLKGEPEETDALFSIGERLAQPDEMQMPVTVLIKQESSDQHDDDRLNDDSEEEDADEDEEVDTEDSEEAIVNKRKPRSSRPGPRPASHSTPRPRVPRRQRRRDPNRPKLNDHKCYICKSDSMESAKVLLEHLSVHVSLTPYTCSECVMETIVLKNVRSLNLHKKMHAQPVKCEYCDRRYSDPRTRDAHVKLQHLGENAPLPSTCEKCGKICKSIAALKNHLRNHMLDVRCGYCGKLFHKRSVLFKHVAQVHEKSEKYECTQCHKVLHSLDSYNIHLTLHSAGKLFNCDLCPMTFSTLGNLRCHKKVHAKNANYKPHKDWTSHYTVSQDPERGKIYTCNLCGNTYSGSINTIISHVKCHFKDVQCEQCGAKFSNKNKLKSHYVVHTRERNYKCQYCGKDYLYRQHMNYHIKQSHKLAIGTAAQPTGSGSQNRIDAVQQKAHTNAQQQLKCTLKTIVNVGLFLQRDPSTWSPTMYVYADEGNAGDNRVSINELLILAKGLKRRKLPPRTISPT
ncbi:zinc finger protein 208-like [Topomyia yanbarensis]|uniref:zinc finger protein 208-like n=1 Tax=Topomyia yanbarensis TaxID=2498891 RepID=UPI00273BF163|nr:zinc finger protein 208-like [Topomyia yanbarensis]